MTPISDYLKNKQIVIPRQHHALYGILYAPENLEQFTLLINAVTEVQRQYPDKSNFVGWRGQAKIKWPVWSGAVRRIRQNPRVTNTINSSTEMLVRKYEENLIDRAKANGYNRRKGRELSELEILASLQHHGAATCLLDFSENIFASLWFAVSESPQETGVLLGVQHIEEYHLRGFDLMSKPIKDLLSHSKYKNSNLWWKSQVLFERMRSQQSVFMFGSTYDGIWSSLTPYQFDYHRIAIDRNSGAPTQDARRLGLFFACAISPKFKSRTKEVWQQFHGYDTETMFPDLEGFSRFNGWRFPIDTRIFK